MNAKAGWLFVAALFTIFGESAGCKSDDVQTPSGNTTPPANTVFMASTSFNPVTITVQNGTTITWKNNDATNHTSTSDSTGWDTGTVAPGASAQIAFNTPGTFHYHCTFHQAMGMVGTVIVQ